MVQLRDTLNIAAAGMKAQSDRLRVVAENIANADSVSTDGKDPYRRKLVSFENVLDNELGYNTVRVTKHSEDMSDFIKKYDPYNPSADEQGYVTRPNVNPMTEMMDMREARRAYEANLSMIDVTKSMLTRTLDLLR